MSGHDSASNPSRSEDAAVRASASGSASGDSGETVVAMGGTLQETLDAFGRAAHFPDYYGANLDALLDCLRDQPSLHVLLTGAERLRAADPDGYRALIGVLRQARAEGDDFHFAISR